MPSKNLTGEEGLISREGTIDQQGRSTSSIQQIKLNIIYPFIHYILQTTSAFSSKQLNLSKIVK